MSEDTQWKPQGESIKDRAIATSRKLLEIGSNNANIVERVVFQEIGRVISPRLEQRIRDVSEDEVRGQLVKLRTWIDDILGEQPEKKVAKRTQSRTGKSKTGKGKAAKAAAVKAAQVSKTAQAKNGKKAANASPVLTTHADNGPMNAGHGSNFGGPSGSGPSGSRSKIQNGTGAARTSKSGPFIENGIVNADFPPQEDK